MGGYGTADRDLSGDHCHRRGEDEKGLDHSYKSEDLRRYHLQDLVMVKHQSGKKDTNLG